MQNKYKPTKMKWRQRSIIVTNCFENESDFRLAYNMYLMTSCRKAYQLQLISSCSVDLDNGARNEGKRKQNKKLNKLQLHSVLLVKSWVKCAYVVGEKLQHTFTATINIVFALLFCVSASLCAGWVVPVCSLGNRSLCSIFQFDLDFVLHDERVLCCLVPKAFKLQKIVETHTQNLDLQKIIVANT